jgi:hypothetical protein
MDQDWARASYAGGLGATVSPYASLDLTRPVSGFSTASLASLGMGGLNGSSTAALGASLFQENNDRDLLRNNDSLSTMTKVTTSSPDLPVVAAELVHRVPATLEQEGVAQAKFTLTKSHSEGDFSKDLQFRDSKFMFGFVSRQKAVLEPALQPLETLGRLSTVEERREELRFNQSKKAAQVMLKKAKGQKDRRTNLMEIKHPYLLEGASSGVFTPSAEFTAKLQRRRERGARKARVQRSRHKLLAKQSNSMTRRGYNILYDATMPGQVAIGEKEKRLFKTKSRRATPIHNSEERLFVRAEKAQNQARTNNLWNRDTGGKPYNIVNSGFHTVKPTGPQADLTRPRDRRMKHPSLIVHGLPHVAR